VKHRDHVTFHVNGRRHDVGAERAGLMLAEYLRVDQRMPGTKIVCAEGDCGACTVLRWFPGHARVPTFVPVNACILPVATLDGSSIVTIEGLAAPDGSLTPVQQAMVACHGSQCGYCTPGFVLAITALAEKRLLANNAGDQRITERQARNGLTGNLCRCTGYEPILAAATTLDVSRCDSLARRYCTPAHVRELRACLRSPVRLEGDGFAYYAPLTLAAACSHLHAHRNARIVAGCTDVGVLHNKGRAPIARAISLHLIPGIHAIERKGARSVRVGAGVTLERLRVYVERKVPELARLLDVFASPQIKHVATLAGNLANASPIGDTLPFLLVAGARVHTVRPAGRRKLPIESFFRAYRTTALARGELIEAIEFDLPSRADELALYKVSQRKDLDIATLSLAVRVRFTLRTTGARSVDEVRLAVGGLAAVPLRLERTEAVLRGELLSTELLERATVVARSEVEPLDDLRGSAAFRRVVLGNLLRRWAREQLARSTPT